MIQNALKSQLWTNRYFILGIALQKGAAYLAVPLAIYAFGTSVYAHYVLLYSIAQILALVTTLGVSTATLVFWYRYEDKGAYVGSTIVLLLGLSGTLWIPAGIALYFWGPSTHLPLSPVLFIAIVAVFSSALSLNQVGLSLIRALSIQRPFAWITVSTSILLAAFLILGKYVNHNLFVLVAIYVFIWAIQAWLFFHFSKISYWACFKLEDFVVFARAILRFSGPMLIYALITLSVTTLDKWVINASFDQATFVRYVIDFQAAFSVCIIALVISMYNFPKVCELTNNNDARGLKLNLLENYWVSLAGSLLVGIAYFGFAWLGHVRLSGNYWILVLAFIFGNLFSVNSTFFQAQARSGRLSFLAAFSTFIFWPLFLIIARFGTINWVCWLYVIYYAALLLVSSRDLRFRLTNGSYVDEPVGHLV